MAELDYAFLADYAATEGGKLNVMGASFTEVRSAALPTNHQLYIAGRVRTSLSHPEVQLKLSIKPPDESYELEGTLDLTNAGQEPYFEDRVGVLFAVGLHIPLPVEGLYTVQVNVDGVESRVLKFTAKVIA